MQDFRSVIHVITNFTARAGAETMLARLLALSTERRVIVVSMIGVSERNRILSNNPAVVFEPLGCGTSGTQSLTDMARAVIRLRAIIRREKPSAVVCWMYHAMILGTLGSLFAGSTARVFWNVRQSLDDPQSLTRSSRLALEAARLLSVFPDGIIYNSRRALELHTARGYRNRNSTVIPNGIPLPEPSAEPRKQARILGIAGRYHPQKDHATFFQAAAIVVRRHPDVRFVAAGAGLTPSNPAITSLLESAGLPSRNIELRGEIDDMPSFYREIDGLVLSSRTEGFPNVVAEAMSYGRPVVGTDVGDTATIIADTGFVCAPGNPDALADAICRLLDLPPDAYRKMCASARSRVERHYSLPEIAGLYHDYLRS